MKHLNQFITEYIVKKKLYKPIDSEDHYKYFPNTKEELRKNIQELLDKNIYNFNCIDTSAITDMSKLFYNEKFEYINIDVSNWDVSNVDNMDFMFTHCFEFDCNLSKWNVSKVKSMYAIFDGCKNFKGNGLENWDVSNVEDMGFIFNNCQNFNCDLSKWDVSNVKDMSHMFKDCKYFDCDLSNWNVSKIIKSDMMFYNCKKFTGKGLENWTVGNVTDIDGMFYNCKNFDCDLSNWDVSNVKLMHFAFSFCHSLKNTPSWYKE